ncbi:MAG TPA: EamA family transporter [Longimicrobiales bacterium]|nr:EamA family transporter [Longimicrobiales bacterium]
MTQQPGTSTLAAFAGAVLIGGANFVAVSISNNELPPFFGAAIRFGIAAILFFLLAWMRGVPLPRRRQAAGAALYGLLGFGVAYAGLYYALVGLSAGTVSVIMAAVPLFTLAIAAALGQERLTVRGLLGGVLAVAGIAVLSLGTLGGDVRGAWLAAAIGGTIAASASSVVARALREVHPLMMNALGMTAGTILLTMGSMAVAEPWTLPRQPATLAAVAWLVLLGSVGLFQLFLYVIRRWTASATVYAITAMPVVAVALGILLLGQPLTPTVAAGGALVMLAVYVGAISNARQSGRG